MGTPANPPPGLDATARQLIQQVAAELADLRREVRAGQRGQRQAQLGHATVDDGAIRFTSASGGVLTAGKQPDGTVAVAAANGPPPPAPSPPQVFPAIGGLSVAWDGLAAASGGADVMPADFDHVDVHVSTIDDFTPDASSKLGTLSRAGSIALTPLDAVEQYVRLVAVSTSGTVSDPSATASGTPLEAPAGGGGDTIPPAAPALSSTIPVAAYIDPSGDARSTATVSWTAPTTNADGTPLDDGSYVEVQYRPTDPSGAAWASVAAAWTDTSVTIVELTPGATYEFQARAVDTSGNASEWTEPVTQTMAVDTDAPATPSAPTVAASLTAVQVTHHLTDNTGHALDDDLDHLDVHIGAATDFTPGATTKAGSLIATKGMIDAGLYAVGTFQVTQTIVCYVKIVAVDRSGNASAPSIAASTTALLIDSAHISDLTASKITSGELGADVVVGARIKTADRGARVELNAAGIQAFDDAGNETLTVSDADGSVSIVGSFQTSGGGRVVLNPNAPYSELRLYNSTNSAYNYLVTNADDTSLTLASTSAGGVHGSVILSPTSIGFGLVNTSANTWKSLFSFNDTDGFSFNGTLLPALQTGSPTSTTVTSTSYTTMSAVPPLPFTPFTRNLHISLASWISPASGVRGWISYGLVDLTANTTLVSPQDALGVSSPTGESGRFSYATIYQGVTPFHNYRLTMYFKSSTSAGVAFNSQEASVAHAM